MKYFFYCPSCSYENHDYKIIPRQKSNGVNTRGGWGVPIQYFNCPQCNYLYAGAMAKVAEDAGENLYYKMTILSYEKKIERINRK